jgi:hypothetical protein
MTKLPALSSIVCSLALFGVGCARKPAVKSVTTTRTHSTTTQDDGNTTSRVVKETKTENQNGSYGDVRTESSNKTTPATH